MLKQGENMSLEASPELRQAIEKASKVYGGNESSNKKGEDMDGIGPDGRYRIPKEALDPFYKTKGESLQDAADRILKEKEISDANKQISDANKHGMSVEAWRESNKNREKKAA